MRKADDIGYQHFLLYPEYFQYRLPLSRFKIGNTDVSKKFKFKNECKYTDLHIKRN